MTSSGYSLQPVEVLAPAAMIRLRRIYEEGFPAHQRDDFAAVTRERQTGELALALVSQAQPSGFAMLRPLGATGWVYLRYFVVEQGRRGQGLGGLLWEQLTARLGQAGYRLLVFDVEDPDEPDCEESEVVVRTRRVRFYQRHGAGLLPVTGYRAPHAGPHTGGWAPMLLMTTPLAGGQAAPDAAQARAIVEAVYRFRWQLEPGQLPVLGLQSGDRSRLGECGAGPA
jgi:GNAT superfamily N-acetyltransferase